MSKKYNYSEKLENKLIKDLVEKGYFPKKNKKFKINGIDGECDAYILKTSQNSNRKYALIFEAKRRDKKESRQKVKKQLKKDNLYIHKNFGKEVRCFNFLVYSSKEYEANQTNKAYTIEWIVGL